MAAELVLIGDVIGMLEGEILRSMLQAHDIEVLLSHEAAGTAIGLTAGPLGAVQLWVRAEHAEAARALLEEYRAGGPPPEGESR